MSSTRDTKAISIFVRVKFEFTAAMRYNSITYNSGYT